MNRFDKLAFEPQVIGAAEALQQEGYKLVITSGMVWAPTACRRRRLMARTMMQIFASQGVN